MQYNNLGKSSIYISEVGLGCMSLRHGSEDLIRRAIDAGINYFDTADLYDYGRNEELLGSAIKGRRDKVIVATKVGNKWDDTKSGWSWDVSRSYLNKAVECSLKRLGTDYIDLYQIHGGTIDDDFNEIVDTLEKLVQAGKIRTYGISSIRPNVFLKYASYSNIVSNMMQYSVLDTRPESYLDVFKKKDISILARGTFAQGILLGKSPKEYLGIPLDKVMGVINQVNESAKLLNISMESVLLSYLLKYKKITSAVVGVRSQDQFNNLLEAIELLDGVCVDFSRWDIPKINYAEHL